MFRWTRAQLSLNIFHLIFSPYFLYSFPTLYFLLFKTASSVDRKSLFIDKLHPALELPLAHATIALWAHTPYVYLLCHCLWRIAFYLQHIVSSRVHFYKNTCSATEYLNAGKTSIAIRVFYIAKSFFVFFFVFKARPVTFDAWIYKSKKHSTLQLFHTSLLYYYSLKRCFT